MSFPPQEGDRRLARDPLPLLLRATVDELHALAGAAELRAELLGRRAMVLDEEHQRQVVDRARALHDAATSTRDLADGIEHDWVARSTAMLRAVPTRARSHHSCCSR